MSQDPAVEERTKRLATVGLLEPLAAEEIARLAQRIPESSFESGEIIYLPGDASKVVFLLLTGRVRLYGALGEQELTFEVVQSGTMFGEASLMERPHDEYAQALEASRVALLDLDTFWHLARQNREVNAKALWLVGERLRLNRSRLLSIALKEVPNRLASLILELLEGEGLVTREGHYKIRNHYTHEQLATMIGAKRVSTTNAFGYLQDIGCVQLRRRQIYVTDLAALQRVAAGDYRMPS